MLFTRRSIIIAKVCGVNLTDEGWRVQTAGFGLPVSRQVVQVLGTQLDRARVLCSVPVENGSRTAFEFLGVESDGSKVSGV